MAYPFPPDVAKLVDERMASGKYQSEDELLRVALQALNYVTGPEHDDKEYWETVEAIREGYAQVQAGQGIPLEDVIARMRQTDDKTVQ